LAQQILRHGGKTTWQIINIHAKFPGLSTSNKKEPPTNHGNALSNYSKHASIQAFFSIATEKDSAEKFSNT
jgi:hypothetical protein